MNINEIQKWVAQNIAQVQFVDEDISDAIEGECRIWQNDDCTLLIDFANLNMPQVAFMSALQQIERILRDLDDKRDAVLASVRDIAAQRANDDVQMHYVAFFVESSNEVLCDFALTASEWGEEIVEFSLEDGTWQFNGWEKT